MKFALTIFFVVAFICMLIGATNLYRLIQCKEKGGVYASPHCFKKESLME